ncbi:carbohydrate ABC transporter permease, partial [Streptomyces sp. BE133]|nr:carbohydrate ABC transporter permease [Streptomyces sp. BE133]
IDSYQSVILPGQVTPFGNNQKRQALRSNPHDHLDAARLDRAGEQPQQTPILNPDNRPDIAAHALYVILGSWNQIVRPQIAQRSPDKYTLPHPTPTQQALTTTNYAHDHHAA